MYGSVPGLTLRNPNTQVTSQQLNDYMLGDASVLLDMALGDRFTVPFSNNNVTINMLVYDVVALRAANRRDGDPVQEALRTYVNSVVGALRDGNYVLLQASSITAATGSADTVFYGPYTQLQAAPGQVVPWMRVYATRDAYQPVFDMDDWIYQAVDANLIAQQRSDRGIGVNSAGL